MYYAPHWTSHIFEMPDAPKLTDSNNRFPTPMQAYSQMILNNYIDTQFKVWKFRMWVKSQI